MNKLQIIFKGNPIVLVFGAWVMGQFIKSGTSLHTLKDDMQGNPFEFYTRLLYLSAVNGTDGKNLDAFNQNDFYDWIDEVGGIMSPELKEVTECFTRSLGLSDKEEDTSAEPKKKTLKRLK